MRKHLFTRAMAACLALVLILSCMGGAAFAVNLGANGALYSSAEFEAEYYYEGDDLGATWSPASTTFRVWAPTATAVQVNLYRSGVAGTRDRIDPYPMTPDVNGTWVTTIQGDLNGLYYTYEVKVDGETNEACDPYARSTGVNGQRAMILDLDSTDPAGWENDTDPHYDESITDAVIYELHVRDLSSDASSGIQNVGKFLGLTETGTTNAAGVPTGLDHIKNLGITHLHLLPSYDYASVDETTLEQNQFNWGYDPVNYNVPEGSYSTDPYHGEVRVKEFKQMVKTLHDNGISVIMDVVYNHVYNAEEFCFNQIVPGYFTRVSADGTYSNGSACGNDTASERAMVKKYIVDSVLYWADEYHIDGFRFDLAGLMDTETINAVIEAVHETHPNVIFYGEGWNMTTSLTKEGYTMATQANSTETPGFSYFSDFVRDSLRGSNSNASQTGYVAGAGGYTSAVRDMFMGKSTWCKSPSQTVNYVSCHDGYALWDRLTMSTRDVSDADRIRMNNLAAAIVMTSQGTPFFQAGEEMLRSKPTEDGFDHNSYKSPDSVNSIKWDTLSDEAYADVASYYAGLIAFRKAHPALRMTTAEEVDAHITTLDDVEFNVVACHISAGANGEENEIVAVFNPRSEATEVTLPAGLWTIYVDGENAGTEALGTAEGTVTVDAISACMLVKEPGNQPETEPPTEEAPTEAPTSAPDPSVKPDAAPIMNYLDLIIAAALAVISGVVIIVVLVKKRKQ